MCGKKVMGIIRSSFLIDERGEVFEVGYKVSPEETLPKSMAAPKGD
jgi:peroxiredoxin